MQRTKIYPFTITNRFRPLLPVPGVATYGTWGEYTWDNSGTLQYGAQLVPECASWRGLFEALDVEGEVESTAPVSLLDEAMQRKPCRDCAPKGQPGAHTTT